MHGEVADAKRRSCVGFPAVGVGFAPPAGAARLIIRSIWWTGHTILEMQRGPSPKPLHKRRCPLLPRGFPSLAFLCLIAAMLLAACGDSTAPIASTAPTTTTTTIVPTTTTTAQPPTESEAPAGIGGFDIDRDAVWQDVYDDLTSSEQSCISDAVGAALDQVLKQSILDEDEVSQQALAILPCLPPQLVRAVFLAGIMLGTEDDGVEVGEEQETCLREVVDEMDVAALVSVIASEEGASDDPAQPENAAQLLEMMTGLLRCLPDLFHTGVDETANFADGVVGASRVVLGEAVEGTLDYDGDGDVFVFEAVEGELYEIEVDLGTLPDSVVTIADADGVVLDFNDDRGNGSLGSRLVWRAPESGDSYVEVSGYGEGSYSLRVGVIDVVDNSADGVVGATRVVLGEAVEGTLDDEGDGDVFVFEAVEGELYEIAVVLGTLPASFVGVDDAGWFVLGNNDDRGDGSLETLLMWRAPESGDFYVNVTSYDEGSYTLRVGVSDIVDDYADGVVGASRVVLEEAVEGVLDYDGDDDYFVFEAVEGELYEIGVALGTLSDSMVSVFDEDGVELGWNDDRVDGSLASLVVWKAPESGDFYVEVSGHGGNFYAEVPGYGEGSYRLTVVTSDIVDDYADGVDGAARLELEEAVVGVLDYPGDVDYFAFEAMEDELYELEVDLGTLADWVEVAVFDEDGVELDRNVDRGNDFLGSRLVWKAPESGEFYVEVSGHSGNFYVVGGYAEGSYSLTVGTSDILDAFGDGVDGAAWVMLGEAVEGVLDYPGDADYFAFQAMEDELYELEVDLGTLSDSVVVVLDAYGWELDRNDNREDGSLASRLLWRSPATGHFYVEVSGFGGEGSYVLTVAISE